MKKAQEIAKNLFNRVNSFIVKTGWEQNWLDAQGKFLALVNLSTDEKWPREEPWNGIFYLRFFYTGKDDEKPVMVGMGSFAANQITLDGNLVPAEGEIAKLFQKLGFGVIIPIPYMTFEQIKKEIFPYYQQLEAEKAKSQI
jgi:hypothetical protein